MKVRKIVLASAAAALLAGGLAGCNNGPGDGFTYRSYSSSLASNWNPHTWETNADDAVLSYLSEGFVSLAPEDTSKGVYQWVYDMAKSVEDVTESHPEDLVKFLGATEEEAQGYVESLQGEPGQFVYEIKLRDGLKWQDGTKIDAQSFIDSGKHLLDPKMLNYRANLYISGESAIAGGQNYYYQGHAVFLDNNAEGIFESPDELEVKDGNYVLKGTDLRLRVELLSTHSAFGAAIDDYSSYYDETRYGAVCALADDDGNFLITTETLPVYKEFVINDLGPLFGGLGEDDWVWFVWAEQIFPEFSWDNVGLYKVDDTTIRYVMANPLDWSQAMVSFSSTWLVHEETYTKNMSQTGDLTTTTYGTSIATTMSYGPYKLETLEASKQMVLVQNENWRGYTKDEKTGKLVSFTDFKVDGATQRQYQATKIVIDVLDDAAAKQKFLAGELTEYSPTASELSEYTLSDALYQVPETYTMSFFFNTDVTALKEMDKSKGNTNSVVLSNYNFRKALSLAINRAEFVTATAAYTPAYAIMNDLYFYDVWNDPTSSYRHSDPAMQAICNLYGVKWGEGEAYKTLKEAYESISGYNLTEAKNLMKKACEELVAAGLIAAGSDVNIKIAYTKGALQTDEQNQISLLNKYVAAACEGSGFGKVTFEGVGNVEDRYGDVPKGEYAVAYGAWGGAAFYPFRNFQVYCDPDQYGVNELGCWDPTKETLTITLPEFEFEDTMTWQKWSNALTGSGKYANVDNELKLAITAKMEEEYLKFYYRIPLCGSTSAFLLGYQVSYFTETYNIMYDFGGFRLMKFNYNDAEWAKYVADHGGTIDYK